MEFFDDDPALVFDGDSNADEFNSWLDPQAISGQDPSLDLDVGPTSGAPLDPGNDTTRTRLGDPTSMPQPNQNTDPGAQPHSHTPTPGAGSQLGQHASLKNSDGFGASGTMLSQPMRHDSMTHPSQIGRDMNTASNSPSNAASQQSHMLSGFKSGQAGMNAHANSPIPPNFSPHLYSNQMNNMPGVNKMMPPRGPEQPPNQGSVRMPSSGAASRQSPQMAMRASLMSPRPMSHSPPMQNQGPPQQAQPPQAPLQSQQQFNPNAMLSRPGSVHMQQRNMSTTRPPTSHSEVGPGVTPVNALNGDPQSMPPFQQGDADFMRRSMMQNNNNNQAMQNRMSPNMQTMRNMPGMQNLRNNMRGMQNMGNPNMALSNQDVNDMEQNANALGMGNAAMRNSMDLGEAQVQATAGMRPMGMSPGGGPGGNFGMGDQGMNAQGMSPNEPPQGNKIPKKATGPMQHKSNVHNHTPSDQAIGSPMPHLDNSKSPAVAPGMKRDRTLSKVQNPQSQRQQQIMKTDSISQPTPGGTPVMPNTSSRNMPDAAFTLPDEKIRVTLAASTLYTQALRFGQQTANITEVSKRVDSFNLQEQRVMIAKFEQSRKETVSSTAELPIMRLVPSVFWRTINEVYSQIRRPPIPEQVMFAGKHVSLMALFQYVQLSGGYIATSLGGNWNQVGSCVGLSLEADDLRILDLMASYVNTLSSFEMYADRNENIRRSLVIKLEPPRAGFAGGIPDTAAHIMGLDTVSSHPADGNRDSSAANQFMRQQQAVNTGNIQGMANQQNIPGPGIGPAPQRMGGLPPASQNGQQGGIGAGIPPPSGTQNTTGLPVPPAGVPNAQMAKNTAQLNMSPNAMNAMPPGSPMMPHVNPNDTRGQSGSNMVNSDLTVDPNQPEMDVASTPRMASRVPSRSKPDDTANRRTSKAAKPSGRAQSTVYGRETANSQNPERYAPGDPASGGNPGHAAPSAPEPVPNVAHGINGPSNSTNPVHRNNNYGPAAMANEDPNLLGQHPASVKNAPVPPRGATSGVPTRYHATASAINMPPSGGAPTNDVRTTTGVGAPIPKGIPPTTAVNGSIPDPVTGLPVNQDPDVQKRTAHMRPADQAANYPLDQNTAGYTRVPAENGIKRQRLLVPHKPNGAFAGFVEGGQYLSRRQHLSTHGGRNVRYLASLGNEIENWWPDVAFPLDLGTVDLHAVTCSLASRTPAEVRQALDKSAAVSANPRVHESVQHCPRLLANLCNLISSMLHQVLQPPNEKGDTKSNNPYALKPCRSRQVHLEIDDVQLLAQNSTGLQPMYNVLKRMRDDPMKKGEGQGEIEIEIDSSTGFETGSRNERPFAVHNRTRIQSNTWPYAPDLHEQKSHYIDEDNHRDANEEWGPSIPDFVSDENKPYYFPSYSTRYERIETEICSLGECRDEKNAFLFTSLCDRLLLATCVSRNLSFSIANRPVIAHKPEFQRLLWQWSEICAENPSLLDTELRTLDLCKDFLTVLGNVGLYLRLPDTRKTLDLMLFLSSFSPVESPYTADGRIKLMDFDIDVHRYLPNAIDVFVKVASREDPNRKLIEDVLSGTSTEPIYKKLIGRWLKAQNRTELYPAELLTRMFSLAVAMSPLTHFRPPSRDIETRQPYLLQGSLAAEVIVNMIPEKDVSNYDIAASWLNSIECFGARLVRTMNFMGMVVLNQPDGESQRPFAKITQRCVNVVQKLFNKAKRNPDFTSSGIVPSIEHLLGGLMAAKMDKTVVKHLSALFDENFAVETSEA